jgi:hypothetical protein
MSFIDRLNTRFEIVTRQKNGADTIWTPKLVPTYTMEREYSGTAYEFIDKAGTLFSRRLPKGKRFELQFVFDGEDNDKIANNFEIAARYEKYWTVTHPFYGKFNCQPLGIKLDNSALTSTTITVTVLETLIIDNNSFISNQDAIDKIKEKIDASKAFTITIISSDDSATFINEKQKNFTRKQLTKFQTILEKATKSGESYKDFKKNLDKALNEINNVGALTTSCIVYIDNLLKLPANITSDIGTRINYISDMLDALGLTVSAFTTKEYYQKLFYNLVGGICVTSMCEALTVKNQNDFKTVADIDFYIDLMLEKYDEYLEAVFSTESDYYDLDHDLLFSIHETVISTAFYLYQLMFEAKQERVFICPKDTNLLLLTHRFYGVASDENIKDFIKVNNIGFDETINISKGREIKYFV